MNRRVTYWFSRGWHDAAETVAHSREHGGGGGYFCTARMAHDRYPLATSTDIYVYLNGYTDGLIGDTFRLNGAKQQVAA